MEEFPAYTSIEVVEWSKEYIPKNTPNLWTLSSGGNWFCAQGTTTELFDERDLMPLVKVYILRSKPV